MSLHDKIVKYICLALPLALSACGGEWQVVYTKDVFPYGNERTAGTGVMYVREVLMPEKMLSLKPETDVTPDLADAMADTLANEYTTAEPAPAKGINLQTTPMEQAFAHKQSK